MSTAPAPRLITRRNGAFQEWSALVANRQKRHKTRSFLVQGVRPLELAIAQAWPMRALLFTAGPRSPWADGVLEGPTAGERVRLAPELLAELGGKDDGVPEVVGVAAIPTEDLGRLGRSPTLVVIADRPSSPGNLGSLIRSADALGAVGVMVAGHAVDPYDPRVVRASRGCLFTTPTVRVDSPAEVVGWAASCRPPLHLVGTGEDGTTDVWDQDLRRPVAVVVGNETAGMSRGWAESCDAVVRIPMVGAASSLNAAAAGSVVLYEAARQRARGAGA